MTGASFKEFYNALYYGADIFLYNNKSYYRIGAGYNDTGHGVHIYKYDKDPFEHSDYFAEIYNELSPDVSNNVEKFLKCKNI